MTIGPPRFGSALWLVLVASAGLSPLATAQDAEPARIMRTICFTPGGALNCDGYKAGLLDPSREVRGEVIRLMVASGSIESAANCGVRTELLIDLLRPDGPVEVRRAAARLLGQFGEDGYELPRVVSLLSDPDEAIRQQVVESIGRMSGNYPFFANDLAALAAHPDVGIRRFVAQAYRALGKPMPPALTAATLALREDAPVTQPVVSKPKPPARLSEAKARSAFADLSRRGIAPESALSALDEHYLLALGSDREKAKTEARRWLAKAEPADRARLKAHFYVWAGGPF